MILSTRFANLTLLVSLAPLLHLAQAWPAVYPEPPPGPLELDGTKLVNDAAHPWRPTQPGDTRGPCPALNTLASHGYLPRNGVATPKQLINAVMEGFNMNNKLAIFVTYAAMLVDGNLVTNLISIGSKAPRTGPDFHGAVPAGGLNTPGFGVEGDASLLRGDAYFGDNHSFNQTLWDEFVDYSNHFGGGYYNLTVAAELRHRAIQRSIATNPNFTFVAPRYFTAYAESALIIGAFLDGRNTDAERKIPMDVALGFFRDSRMPADFHRAAKPTGNDGVVEIFSAHPISPGGNVVRTWRSFCVLYENFVQKTVKRLYPNPTGVVRRNLILNLQYFYSGQPSVAGCTQLFPYGQL
ncbi:aromatic peroxygenase precursor [Coprinellus micaceus]|uniref:Aromatic peroxygenase n=1 Tax=Coprinellus micaceus TaxID=71717 RepID=A0A4Y7SF31_COPMI|nr:aromatic peroxygenase precursor [Coprinellus micaceus]